MALADQFPAGDRFGRRVQIRVAVFVPANQRDDLARLEAKPFRQAPLG
nr:hypothetical protein [Streptomyces sp. NRRL S-241]